MDEIAREREVVLVVDDSADNLALLSSLLKGTYRVKVATSGAKGLEIAASAAPDLILLDVMMPGLDGYETCRRLKRDPRTSAVPVIFLSAKGDPSDEEAGREAGAAAYLVKPPDPELLLESVRDHLRRGRP